jgi:predicted lipoprotein
MKSGKDQIDVILLDFAKAFDKVPHKRLLHKLCHYGVRGKTLQWITYFLSSGTQQVLVEGCESAKLDVLSGDRKAQC